MARYIDADVLKEELKVLTIFVTGMLCGKTHLTEVVEEYKKSILKHIDEFPDADVVPRKEVAREIFEKIEKVVGDKYNRYVFGNNDLGDEEREAIINFSDSLSDCFCELKKKYVEGER